uniref:PX domain-containing protein n=1 Tax=Meloidogyne floridensis TaxID=298350 RepID=A0A915NZG3_9BILA
PPPLPQVNNPPPSNVGSAIYELPPVTGPLTTTKTTTTNTPSLYPTIQQEPSAPAFDPWDDPKFGQTSTFGFKNNQNQPPPETKIKKMLFARRRATNTSFYFNNEELSNFDNLNDNNNLEYTSSKEQQQIEDVLNKSEQDEEGKEENIKSKKGGEEFKEKTILVEQHSLLTTSSETSKTNTTTTTGKQASTSSISFHFMLKSEFTSASHSITNDSTTNSTNKMVGRSHSTGPETGSQIISKQQQQQIATGGTTRIKNLNRFTNFVKTGMEGYILSTAKFTCSPVEQPQIILDARIGGVEGVMWNSPSTYYTCNVTKPKKETKLKGLKSFIAYSLTCSTTGIQVSRRYKQFDWLHLQLTNKYLIIPIPPLPEKQVSGRYEEDLIEHRRSVLQLWVNKICRHPVLSQSEVWKHFMSCTDETKWKKGKRLAERDEYVGGNFFSSVNAPNVVLDVANVGTAVERFARLSRSLDESCRKIYDQVVETQKRMAGPYKANWQKMAAAFDSLGQSLDIGGNANNSSVQNAIKTSAHVLHKIGEQHEEYGHKHLEQLLDFLFVAKGTFAAIPDVVNIHKSAFAKIRENERYQNEGKLSAEDAENIRQKVDVCSYSMLAEINHQQSERDLDFATMFGSFFSQQAAFYHNIGNQLTHLASLYKPK